MLELKIYKCIDGNVLSALTEIGNTDNDFNGYNGEEYLWKEAKENGFTSNLAFTIDYVKELPMCKCVEKFLDIWMGNDSYYIDFQYEILTDDDGTPLYVAVTYITD